jgi:hypothetical protein
MSSTKRVSGDYDIYADNVNINGNLTIVGAQTTVESTNSSIKDNIIVLNQGEAGAGITLGTAGIQIDRGSSPDVLIRYNEALDQWEFTNDGSIYSAIGAAGAVSAAGADTQIQYNASGTLGAESNFRYDYNTNTLFIGNIQLVDNTISTNNTNGNLVLDTNGTGKIVFEDATSFKFLASIPTSTAGYNHLYANTPSGGGTGLYFVNTTTSDELVSKTKATVLALIFS